MKIAQVAPLWESVPPKLYGGTERVVSYLTEELVNQGHEVTLFASGDSVTRANLVPVTERALRLDRGHVIDPIAHHVRMLEMVFQQAHEFDVVHFHTDYLHFPLVKRLPLTTLTTLHGRLDIPDLIPLFRQFSDVSVTSVSDAALPRDLKVAHFGADCRRLTYLARGGFHPKQSPAFLARLP